MAESFFATLKEELVHRATFPTRAAARRAIFEFIEVFYNRCRLHSTLNYRTPGRVRGGAARDRRRMSNTARPSGPYRGSGGSTSLTVKAPA